jgi:hypothetical protein
LGKFICRVKIFEKNAPIYFEESMGSKLIRKCTINKYDLSCNLSNLWKLSSLELALPFVKRNSKLPKQIHYLEIGSAASLEQ